GGRDYSACGLALRASSPGDDVLRRYAPCDSSAAQTHPCGAPSLRSASCGAARLVERRVRIKFSLSAK
ncbi:MAG: hypothetical protein AB2594_12995, partial [Candidatus Thiodiazotropha sp.]